MRKGPPGTALVNLDTTHQRIEDVAADICAEIHTNGPFAPGNTLFAIGNYTEDRLVWFDFLTVTSDDIMLECGLPEEQRERQISECRQLAEDFLRYHDGPEQTLPLLEG